MCALHCLQASFFFPSRERVQEEDDVYLISYIPYYLARDLFFFFFLFLFIFRLMTDLSRTTTPQAGIRGFSL